MNTQSISARNNQIEAGSLSDASSAEQTEQLYMFPSGNGAARRGNPGHGTNVTEFGIMMLPTRVTHLVARGPPAAPGVRGPRPRRWLVRATDVPCGTL